LEKYEQPKSYESKNQFQNLYVEHADIEEPPGLAESSYHNVAKVRMPKVQRKRWSPVLKDLQTDTEDLSCSKHLCRPFGLGYPVTEGILPARGFKSRGGRVEVGTVEKKADPCVIFKPNTFELSSIEEIFELSNVESNGEEYIEMTVDSGASDTVANRDIAPSCEIRPSEGSRKGVKYVAAAGKTISNEGEKRVKAETEEGHICNLKIQVTAVNKALLSVSKICDAGHEVIFTKTGGRIVNCETGQVIGLRRVDGVYRIRLKSLGRLRRVLPGQGCS
jgi:hypothetical protein